MNLLSEFGTDFPVSGGLQQFFDKCKTIKKVSKFIRTLLAVAYVYEEKYVLIIPLRVIQTAKMCREVTDFLTGASTTMPKGVFYSEMPSKILDFAAVPGTAMKFICVLDSLESHNISFSDDLTVTDNVEKLNLTGKIASATISFPFIVAYLRNNDKYDVYASSLHNVNKVFSIQCTIDEISEVYVYPPTLYFRCNKGVYGCSLDEIGARQFPRAIAPVIEATNLVTVKAYNGFYLYSRETSELLCIKGRKVTRTNLNEKVKDAQQFFVLGPYLFALLNERIIVLDFITGEVKNEMSVPKTSEWMLSLDQSYGAVCLGTKSYSISRVSLPPLINLYASPSELREMLKKAKEATGTVATPIILMANRSPYLAATMMKNDLQAEINSNPAPGSIQEFLRPSLTKINTILQEKP